LLEALSACTVLMRRRLSLRQPVKYLGDLENISVERNLGFLKVLLETYLGDGNEIRIEDVKSRE